MGPSDGVPAIIETGAKRLSNAAQVFTLPGWGLAYRVLGLDPVASAPLAFAIGWAMWVAAGLAAWWALARLRGSRKRVVRAADAAGARVESGLTRRELLARTTVGLGAAGTLGLGSASTLVTPWSLRIARHRIALERWPEGLDGLRIAFVSDTHLGPRVPAAFIASAIARAVELGPDLFLLGGDYIHMGSAHIDAAASMFAPMVATGRPVFAVLGNHDHYGDGSAMASALERVGVRVLNNARAFVGGDRRTVTDAIAPDSALCVGGVGDLLEGVVDVRLALAGVPSEMPRLLLSHHPDVAEHSDLAHFRADLLFAGHTHGGQVRFPIIGAPVVPSRYGPKYAHGLVRGPRCPVLISAGVGMSVFPVRWGVPPEIHEITLVGA